MPSSSIREAKGRPSVLVIGLDCAEPSLVFEKWRQDLPNLSALMAQGIYGRLRTTDPPVTVPAWASFLTSKDPGQLGLYGFRNRMDHSQYDLTPASSVWVKEMTLDRILSRNRLRSILVGVPLTYPPRPLNGLMVSGCLTPGKEAEFTWPPELKLELDRAAGGEYIIDAVGFRTRDRDELLAEIWKMTEARFKAAEHLMTTQAWDFFMMVEMGVDRMHHAFWRYLDPGHRLHEPNHRFGSAIKDYYVRVDELVGRLAGLAPENCLIMAVSDHGARTMEGGFSLNQWLWEEGYLVLKSIPDPPARLSIEMIDWPKTRVWGEGGYYGRIFINLAGREPEGVVAPSEYDGLRRELEEGLEGLEGPDGSQLGNQVLRPENIYRAVRNAAPDLLAYFGGLGWRSVGMIGRGQPLFVFENDTGPDDANHAREGMLAAAVKGRSPGYGLRTGLSIYDAAPTILNHLGIDVPDDMIGRPIDFGY